MKKFTQILGFVGLVGLGVGFFALLIGRKLNIFIELQLVIGLGLTLLGLFSNLAGLRLYFVKRTGRTQTGAIFQILLILVAIFLVGTIVYQHNWLLDVTRNRLYTLSGKTKEVLKELPGDIKITAFLTSEGYENTKQLLRLFQEQSNKLKVEVIDPDRHPQMAEAKSVDTYGTVIFEYGKRETRVVDPGEEEILNSLIRVTRPQSWLIYFTTGHGEADPDQEDKGGMSLLKHYLEQENFIIKKLQIPAEGIPADARVLVIAGPRGLFQDWEVNEIDRYIGKGGDAVFLLDPFVPTNLEFMFYNSGLELLNGAVVDEENYMVGMDAIGLSPVVSKFAKDNVMTMELDGKLAVFPRVRPLRILGSPDSGGYWVPLVFSSDKSFVETNLEGLFKYGRVQRTKDKPAGPQLLAAAYQERVQHKPWEQRQDKRSKESRVAVVGNSHFMRNLALEVYSNFTLAINIFNWAAGEHDYVPIAPKKRSASRIYLTERQTSLIFYSAVLIIPEILSILGIAVWWRRK